MSRSARLDAPGILHDVIIRGIEHQDIFRDKTDKPDKPFCMGFDDQLCTIKLNKII